jgi:cell division protease FtsH
MMMGGRAAEQVVLGDETTGAENDIDQITRVVRQMVGRWGMSETIGLVAVLPIDGRGLLVPGVNETSQATQQLVDDEVRRLIEDAHSNVTELLSAHRPQLDALTQALLEEETLDGIDAYRAAGLPMQLPEQASAIEPHAARRNGFGPREARAVPRPETQSDTA